MSCQRLFLACLPTDLAQSILQRSTNSPASNTAVINSGIANFQKMRVISILIASPSFWVFLVVNVFGGSVVALGLWGEGHAERKVFPEIPGDLVPHLTESKERKRCKRFFERLVLFGVVFEVIAAVVTTVVSSIEVAQLNREAADTRAEAEQLRKANIELNARLNPRRITAEQLNNFKFLTEDIPKIPIKIATVSASEPMTFAHDLREMFSFARFKTNTDVEADGMNSVAGIPFSYFGWTNHQENVWIVNGGKVGKISYHIATVHTNGFDRPVVVPPDETNVYFAISMCLKQIGIKTTYTAVPYVAEADKFAVFVVEKH
jgi:hypothetical protein